MPRVDGFDAKIASLNSLSFSLTAAGVTYVDARLKSHVAFGARIYPHGYLIAMLGNVPCDSGAGPLARGRSEG